MDKDYKITQKGKEDLEKELVELKSQRGDIADKIASARDFGDLSENAEYDAARAEQGLVETRIAEIEEILQNATIIKSRNKSEISLGSVVELDSNGKKVTYTLVGPVEANPLEGKISDESPIGKELLGKKINDEIVISTPKAKINYIVTSLS